MKKAALLLLAVCMTGISPAGGAVSDAGYNNGKIFEFMNAERQARGVRPVARDPGLDRKAQEWADKLASEGRMYHSSTYGAQALGYRSWSQNLAYHDDSLTAARAHDMWMASAVHRKNMLDPDFSHVGIAMACSTKSGRAYVTAVVEFGGDGSPSRDTPPRNPQVAGSSDASRAMSCDGASGPPAVPPASTLPTAAGPADPAAAGSPATSLPAAGPTVPSSGSSTTLRRAATSTTRGAPVSTTSGSRPAGVSTTLPAASSTLPPAGGAASTSTTLLATIAAAPTAGSEGSFPWPVVVAAGAALLLLRFRRPAPRRGRHSIRR